MQNFQLSLHTVCSGSHVHSNAALSNFSPKFSPDSKDIKPTQCAAHKNKTLLNTNDVKKNSMRDLIHWLSHLGRKLCLNEWKKMKWRTETFYLQMHFSSCVMVWKWDGLRIADQVKVLKRTRGEQDRAWCIMPDCRWTGRISLIKPGLMRRHVGLMSTGNRCEWSRTEEKWTSGLENWKKWSHKITWTHKEQRD